jgi:beta-N-acetylhexosaminidase
VGHIINRNLDPTFPASLSPAMIDGLLRGQLGWQGPVITDDLQAAAIAKNYKRADAIANALNAGADLLLFGNPGTNTAFYTTLVDSIESLVKSGRVPEARLDQAVARVALLRSPV